MKKLQNLKNLGYGLGYGFIETEN